MAKIDLAITTRPTDFMKILTKIQLDEQVNDSSHLYVKYIFSQHDSTSTT